MEDYEIRVPQPGEHYQHYKGGRYEVLAVGRLSELRSEIMVVYRSLERGHVWIRPLGMWGEYVEHADPSKPMGLVFDGVERVVRTKRFTLCADSPPSTEAIPLSDEEVEELDRELALTLKNARPYERQRCQHLRKSPKAKAGATIRVTTTPDKADSMQWECRIELELCVLCGSYAMGPLFHALRSEPILCAEYKG